MTRDEPGEARDGCMGVWPEGTVGPPRGWSWLEGDLEKVGEQGMTVRSERPGHTGPFSQVQFHRLYPKNNGMQWRLVSLGSRDQLINFNLSTVSFIHGEGNGSPLQYSCLENPMGGRAW